MVVSYPRRSVTAARLRMPSWGRQLSRRITSLLYSEGSLNSVPVGAFTRQILTGTSQDRAFDLPMSLRAQAETHASTRARRRSTYLNYPAVSQPPNSLWLVTSTVLEDACA